jgi:hypothetical protein
MGAFDNYQPPPATAPSSGAFANYRSPPASSEIAQPGDSLGNMSALDPRAANSSWKDFLLAHLSELGSGASQLGSTAADYARTAANVYGQGDSTLASLKALYADATGNARNPGIADLVTRQVTGQSSANDYLSNLAAAKADTAAASSRLGTAGTIAANLTGGGPLGEVAGAVKGMIPAAGRFAGPLAGAITGGGATTAGELGRNENLSPWDIGIGTVTGGVGGAPAGKGGTVAPPVSADDLTAAAKKAYAPLTNVLYDATKEIHPAIDPLDAQNALRDWSGYKWNDATKTKGEINTLLNKPQLSANDIQQSQSYLKGIAGDGRSDPNDALYAAHYAGKLQDVLDNATPQTGVPQNWTPSPGGPPSFASTTKAAGDALYSKAQDVGRLNDWVAKSQVAGGPDIGGQASAYLRTSTGQTFAPPGSPAYEATNAVAGTAAKESSIPWWVKHFVIAPAVGTIAGEGVQAATGEHENPLEHLGVDLATGLALAGGSMGYSGLSGMRARAAQQRALNAARSTLSTGNYQAPIAPDQPFRDALRRLIFSQGAAGQLPGQ